MSEEMNLSLEEASFPLTIGGEKYVIREATGAVSVKYRNAMLACMTLGADGKPKTVAGLNDTELLLISLCLFKLDELGGHEAVPLKTIQKWPSRVCKKIYAKIKDVSELNEDTDASPEKKTATEESEKNE